MNTEKPEPPEGYRIIPNEWLRSNLIPMDAKYTYEQGAWIDSHYCGEMAEDDALTEHDFYATRTPIPSPEHNPDGLTSEQVGEGYRLLKRGEPCEYSDEWWMKDKSRWHHMSHLYVGHVLDNFTIRRRVTPIPATGGEKGEEPELLLVQMQICKACLDGVGQECHTAGCAMWLHKVDLPFDPNIYQVIIPKLAETHESLPLADDVEKTL